jgi:hypothetical protein
MHNNYLLLLGIAYLFVGNLDLLHTLSYKGIRPVFPGTRPQLPVNFGRLHFRLCPPGAGNFLLEPLSRLLC